MRRTPIERMRALDRGSTYMRYDASQKARQVWLDADPCDVYIWADSSATVNICGYKYELPYAQMIDAILTTAAGEEE